MSLEKYVRPFDTLNSEDTKIVGGKNASLGEMIASLKDEGIAVPDGFATTAQAYWDFLKDNELDEEIRKLVDRLNKGSLSLEKTGSKIRNLIKKGEFSEEFKTAVGEAYEKLGARYDQEDVDTAVRSSATAEDLPDASFAGQQETFLNVVGESELLSSIKRCYASLFTDRAISYRTEKGFDHLKVALSAGVQKMIRSDLACSGVMFSLDTDTGFPRVVVINGAWGLGETVVQGTVNPDEFRIFKPLLENKELVPIIDKIIGQKEKKMVYAAGSGKTTKIVNTSKKDRGIPVLNDEEILYLARCAKVIEEHYDMPMDMEWAKDGETGDIYIVQARPETVHSAESNATFQSYSLKEQGKVLAKGLAVGQAVTTGKVQRIKSASNISRFEQGNILVTEMTDPDWVPIMKKAAGIVTEHGGRTSHAAIVSRELSIPAVVGAVDALGSLQDGQAVTLSCAEGDTGYIYEGELDYEVQDIDLGDIPKTKTRIMMNIASPQAAFRWWRLPARGIGLARMEFIINNIIKIHPKALLEYDDLEDDEAKKSIDELTAGYEDRTEYFIDNLARGIAKIAAVQHPEPVLVRMSDFKTNEYADLIGGRQFEPHENNPMLGFRGASRYYSDHYRKAFALECRAVKRARERIGMDNIIVMIPFCRTPEEADKVLGTLAENSLVRGENGLEVYVMAEIPSNIILAPDFADRFDGFSIGSNDLTQLVLGVDRDSTELADLFDERHPAVQQAITTLIHHAHDKGKKVGICGQGPSDHPDFAEFLVKQGIDTMSLNPDSIIPVIRNIARIE